MGGDARRAVRAIQARAGGERGGVALVEEAAGGLSLADETGARERAAAAKRARELH